MLNDLLKITENAAEHGTQIDFFLEAAHWFMLILFVGWSIFFLYTLYRFWGRRNPKADYQGVKSHASSHAEMSVIIVEAVLLLGFAFPLWAKRVNEIPPEGKGVVRIHAVAEQFGWTFHYPGEDGVFGAKNPLYISGANPRAIIGLDPNDPHGLDDVVSRTYMNVPVDRPVVVDVTSKDVIHNYAVAHMRISQDTVPGMRIPLWFTPVRTGEFEIVCAQLCGAGHYSMKGILEVQTEQAFQEWLKSKTPAAAPVAPEAVPSDAPAGGDQSVSAKPVLAISSVVTP